MKCLITGGAGFIGSGLALQLMANGHEVVVVDDFATGYREHLDGSAAQVVELNLAGPDPELPTLREAMLGADRVFHLAANADVRFGWDHPRRDLAQNVDVTMRVAEAAVSAGVPDFVFSSTGSVYGEAEVVPTPEDAPFPIQTSLYGASKAAAEGFLAAYAEAERLNVTVFRFVSVLGPRYSHGHVIDFARQLRKDPTRLRVLGDGTQRKSYMHVSDCIDGVIGLSPHSTGFQVFNLGIDGHCTVNDSIGWITERMGVKPQLEYTGGNRGWVGDNPLIHLDTSRANAAGWKPERSIRDSVIDTVDWLLSNEWLLDDAQG